MQHWSHWLEPSTYDFGVGSWARDQPDAFTAWSRCPRPEWLLWGLASATPDQRTLVLCVASCAEWAFSQVPSSDRRPREAVQLAVRVATGRAEWETLHHAINAATDAQTSAPSMAATHAATAALAVCMTVSGPRPLEAATAAHSAVEAAANAASVYVAAQQPAILQARASLCDMILRRSWPAASRIAFTGAIGSCRPAVQVAFDYAAMRSTWPTGEGELRPLDTARFLASRWMRQQLVGCIAQPTEAEQTVLTAVAEQLADQPQTLEAVQRLLRVQNAE